MKTIRTWLTILLLLCGGASHADPVPVDGLWQEFLWVSLGDPGSAFVGGCGGDNFEAGACGDTPPTDTEFTSDPPWTFTALTNVRLTVVAGVSATTFSVFEADADGLPLSLIGNTPFPSASDPGNLSFCFDPAECLADPTLFSIGEFILGPGAHSFSLTNIDDPATGGIGFFRVQSVPEPSGLLLLAGGLLALAAFRRTGAR